MISKGLCQDGLYFYSVDSWSAEGYDQQELVSGWTLLLLHVDSWSAEGRPNLLFHQSHALMLHLQGTCVHNNRLAACIFCWQVSRFVESELNRWGPRKREHIPHCRLSAKAKHSRVWFKVPWSGRRRQLIVMLSNNGVKWAGAATYSFNHCREVNRWLFIHLNILLFNLHSKKEDNR